VPPIQRQPGQTLSQTPLQWQLRHEYKTIIGQCLQPIIFGMEQTKMSYCDNSTDE